MKVVRRTIFLSVVYSSAGWLHTMSFCYDIHAVKIESVEIKMIKMA
jgi:hypothetical protein